MRRISLEIRYGKPRFGWKRGLVNVSRLSRDLQPKQLQSNPPRRRRLLAGFANLGLRAGFLLLADDAAEFLLRADGGFFDVGGAEGAEVVGCLETVLPGGSVHVAQGLHVGAR